MEAGTVPGEGTRFTGLNLDGKWITIVNGVPVGNSFTKPETMTLTAQSALRILVTSNLAREQGDTSEADELLIGALDKSREAVYLSEELLNEISDKDDVHTLSPEVAEKCRIDIYLRQAGYFERCSQRAFNKGEITIAIDYVDRAENLREVAAIPGKRIK